MDAYYYGFDSTGNEVIDKILSAVACAGKAYHHTECWLDETCEFPPHVGTSPVDWIQNAAREAAAEIDRLRAELAAAKALCEYHPSEDCPLEAYCDERLNLEAALEAAVERKQ